MGSHCRPLGRTPERPLSSSSPSLVLSHKEGAEIGNRAFCFVASFLGVRLVGARL